MRLQLEPMLGTGLIPVIGGFMGATRQGVTTTLGRGGADATAAVIGTLLEAQEIQIWTEVDGLMNVDPKVVADAQVIPSVSPEEAAELAYFGTKVLHPAMIRPAVEKGIPVRVCNTQQPGGGGHPGERHRAPRTLGPARGRLSQGHHRGADLDPEDADGLGLPAPGLRGLRALRHAGGPDRDLRGLDLRDHGRRGASGRDQVRPGAARRGADPARVRDREPGRAAGSSATRASPGGSSKPWPG